MEKIDNSHLCALCTGDGLDGGQEVCKPCKGTGIEKQYWHIEIVELKDKLFNMKHYLGLCNYAHLPLGTVKAINRVLDK